MPRPGQPPPSALRNRNRITNKTRLKVIHGNVDVDQIIPDEDEEKNRLLQIVAGVDLEDAKEHHLQAVLSEAAGHSTPGRKNQEKPAAFIPIPEHTGLADNYSTLYPSDRWNDPVSYVQSSAVVEECITAALANECTYYMDERDKEWLDRNNEEARGEGTSAQGAVSPSTGRTTTRSAKAKGKEPEDVQALFMTEDEYELVMGLFEKITQEKTEFLHHSLESDTMHFPEFSEYQDILSSPLPPSTFAAYSPPSWLPEPSKFARLARVVYPYWKERCLERAGRRIIPTLNFDESDTLNESYVCFRRRETKAIRKTRASQVTSSDKLTRLQNEFEFPLQLAKQLVEREQLKRDSSRQSRIVWDLRMKMVELKVKNPSIGDKGDEELLVDKERLSKKSESSRVRLPVKQETPSRSSPPTHNIIRPKERQAFYQTNIDKLLQIRKDQDQHWDDHVDTGYVSTMAPYASRLFKYIGPPQSSSSRWSADGESAVECVPKRPIRLRCGRGGRAFVDRRPPPLRIAKRRRLARFSDDEQTLMDTDSSPSKDDEAELRLAERWRFDSDDGPLYGPAGSDEHDRMLVDDYDPKYTHSLFDVADYAFLYTDPTIVRTLPDGKKENYIPYRLGITPPMNIAVPQRPSAAQSQGAVPVSQQVHSVPISQQLKLPAVGNRSSPSLAVSNQGAVNTSAQAVVAPASQGSPPPRLQTAMPLPQVTHNGRAAMTMPSVDMMKLATSHNASAFQSENEAAPQADPPNGSDPSQLPRPNTQSQQVHAQQSTQMQSQAAAQAQPSTVSSLHPAYAALVNANPTTYIPQYLYPNTSTTGLNNLQMQHLKSVFNAANLGSVQNYNSAVFAHMQMPKAANGVVNGIPAAQNMHNFNSVNMTLKPPGPRQMQRVPSAVVNGASPSPPRPSSVVNGTMHDSNGSSSPLMNHAAVPGEPRVSTRSPSGMGIRGSGSPIMGAQLHAQQQQQMLNGQMQQQLLQLHNQSSPPPSMYTAQSYSLSPSPSKMQPASLSGSPVLHQHQHQQQQQQQQQVAGNSHGVY